MLSPKKGFKKCLWEQENKMEVLILDLFLTSLLSVFAAAAESESIFLYNAKFSATLLNLLTKQLNQKFSNFLALKSRCFTHVFILFFSPKQTHFTFTLKSSIKMAASAFGRFSTINQKHKPRRWLCTESVFPNRTLSKI